MNTEYTFSEESYSLLQSLMTIVSPSMGERVMHDFLQKQMVALGMNVQTDIMGNLHASCGASEALQIGIVAHMDTVALQISSVLPCGAATCRFIGLRPHVALGQPLKVITKNGIVDAVVGFDTTSQYGQPKGLIEDDLWIDLGVSSRQEALQLVEIGDLVVLAPRLSVLNHSLLCGAGLDDRVGLIVMLETAKQLIHNQVPVGVHLYGSVQEEIGLRGANILLRNQSIDACFIVDMDYATDIPAGHENQMGALALGKGVGLHMKADNNPELRALACRVAEKQAIPYQKSLGRFLYGGTDATPIQTMAAVPTININVPCRYMHSPVEICHVEDIQNAVRLLVQTIAELSKR